MARRDSARKPGAGPVALQLAAGLARRAGPGRRRTVARLRELGAVDRAIYAAVAATPTRSLDEPLRRLSAPTGSSVRKGWTGGAV